jgi:2-oxoisovalerate dehydrogenase E2 component (dihydrolipoyl transacylase)
MSTLDRALLASMRAAAEAGEAADAALEAADLLTGSTESNFASWTEAAGASFSGEGSVVRQEAPKREVNTAPVPERQAGGGTARDIVKASPAVRVMAARLGVKLEDVRATGPDGRVTQQDVQNSVPRPSSPAQASNAAATSRAAPSVPAQQLAVSPERSQIPEMTKVEFGRTRKVMYRAMGDQAHVPHFG